MKLKLDKTFFLELLIVLLVINYMVVTIIFRDNFMLKYFRDILLITLLILSINKKSFITKCGSKSIYMLLLFGIAFIISCLKTSSVEIVLLVFRRYFFPIAILIISINVLKITDFNRIVKFILYFMGGLSFFGIFQALILGDKFLRNLGYPVEYSYGYGREMLYNSYYFGGLGIQRVVATLSSSNTFALLLGVSLIFIVICDKYIYLPRKRYLYIVICLAYLLTFSRSNFLALFILVLFFAWKNIPNKKRIFYFGIFMSLIVIVYFCFNRDLAIKIANWIISSLNMSESSASGRSVIWAQALKQIVMSPLGVGLGHVGKIASNAGISDVVFSCENSYFTLALDTGWLGVISYVLFLVFLIDRMKQNRIKALIMHDDKSATLFLAGRCILIYLFIVIFFSNHIQNMESFSYVYFVIGIIFANWKPNSREYGDLHYGKE